jgi:quercetin dioxygenase-like cupin family protein
MSTNASLTPHTAMSRSQLDERFIPFSGLKYSTEAFIDYRIPGCGPKYNYALVGPGVSQNPNQPVSFREKHGFQVGGVAMPHGVVNPPHMHFTCEVFICTHGDWQLHWGFNPDKLTADFAEGDIATVPTWVYRGFKNIGADDGFVFTALGGDDTGGILWGPTTLEAAAAQGVYLTEDYQIIDEQAGGKLNADTKRLQPMSLAQIQALRTWTVPAMSQRIVRFKDLVWSNNGLVDSLLPGCGAQLAPVIGAGMSQDRNALAPVMNPHGLSIEWLRIAPGGSVSLHRLKQKQVLTCKQGQIELFIQGRDNEVQYSLKGHAKGWDTYAVPANHWRRYHNSGDQEALLIVLTSGDERKTIEWSESVLRDAAKSDFAIDANGYVAPKNFVDRSQR